MLLFRLALFLKPCLYRLVMLQCQDPALFSVLPLYIQRAARCATALILILPGKPFPRLGPDLTEPFSAYGTFEPYAGFVKAQSHSSLLVPVPPASSAPVLPVSVRWCRSICRLPH